MSKAIYLFFIIIFILTIFITSNLGISDTNFIFPSKIHDISSNYGYRDLFGKISFHDGVDFLAPYKSEVYSSLSGTVSYVGFLNGYGNTITITHDNSYKTSYSHLDSNFLVKVGDYINKGDIIGFVGPKYLENGILNGLTTGPHLHFRIFKDNNIIDPLSVLKK